MSSHWMLGFGNEGHTIIQTIFKWKKKKANFRNVESYLH